MKILFCTNVYPPHFVGGAELVVHEHAKIFARLGHEVRVFAGDLSGTLGRYEVITEIYEGIEVTRVGLIPQDYDPAHMNFLHPQVEASFEALLADIRPDVVHCHNLMGLSVRLPEQARRVGARVICTFHDLWGYCLRNTAIRTDGRPCFDRSLCHQCLRAVDDGQGGAIPVRLRTDFVRAALDSVDTYICPSHFFADAYIAAGFPAAKIRVVSNGIDLDRFSPAVHQTREGPARFTYIGHLGDHKGVGTLIAAFGRLDRSAFLNIVGQGPGEVEYRAQVARLGIEDRVRFWGRVPHAEIVRAYAETDILVLPSIWDENQPVCLMEAMACGLPVIATAKGGVPELVSDWENGLLVEAGNVDDLAAAMERLGSDVGLRRAFGDAGRARMAHQSYEDQGRHLLEVYRESPATEPGGDDILVAGTYRKATPRQRDLINDVYRDGRMIAEDWIPYLRTARVGRLVYLFDMKPFGIGRRIGLTFATDLRRWWGRPWRSIAVRRLRRK